MKLILRITLLFLLLPVAAWAASWAGQVCTAASATVAEIQACINGVTSAMSGAVTINVPAGSQTWTTNVSLALTDVSDPAPNFTNVTTITIAGAGKTSTVITDNNGSTTSGLFNITGLDGKRWVMTGIGFSGLAGPALMIYGTTGLTNPATQGFRIYNNDFSITTGGGNHSVWVDGNTYGLVDNNTFLGGKVLVENTRSTFATQDSKFTENQDLGTPKFVFIEDNTTTVLGGGYGTNAVDASASARVVYRFNTVTDGYLETHCGCPNGFRGVRALEYYKNSFTGVQDIPATYRAGLIRSGTGVMWGNTVYGDIWNVKHFEIDSEMSCTAATGGRACGNLTGYRSVLVSNNTYFDGSATPSCRDGSGSATFPCQDQVGRGKDAGWTTSQAIEPLYGWENWYGATAVTIRPSASMCAYTSTVLAANRDYYNQDNTNCAAAGTTCTYGVGVGTKAQLNPTVRTCTAGVAFWVTDEGYWNSTNDSPTVTADGVLYKCTATDTWTPYYIPYPYPHPLRSGLSAPTGVTAE